MPAVVLTFRAVWPSTLLTSTLLCRALCLLPELSFLTNLQMSSPPSTSPLPSTLPSLPSVAASASVSSTVGVKRRRNLSISERASIRTEHLRRVQENEPNDQRSLSVWAQQHFSLPYAPSQSTISRIISTTQTDIPSTSTTRIRHRQPLHPGLERVVACWMWSRREGEEMSARKMGDRLITLANQHVEEQYQLKVKLSNGWIMRFGQRWGKGRRDTRGPTTQGKLWGGVFGHLFELDPIEGKENTKQGRMCEWLACVGDDGEMGPVVVVGKKGWDVCKRMLGDAKVAYMETRSGSIGVEAMWMWLRLVDEWVRESGTRKELWVSEWNGFGGGAWGEAGLKHVELRRASHAHMAVERVSTMVRHKYREEMVERVLDARDVGETSGFDIPVADAVCRMKRLWHAMDKAVVKRLIKTNAVMNTQDMVETLEQKLKLIGRDKVDCMQWITCAMEKTVGLHDWTEKDMVEMLVAELRAGEDKLHHDQHQHHHDPDDKDDDATHSELERTLRAAIRVKHWMQTCGTRGEAVIEELRGVQRACAQGVRERQRKRRRKRETSGMQPP